MSKNVLILGATSGIAEAICHELSKRGDRLILTGRNVEEMEKTAADLRVRHQTDPVVVQFDALDFDGHGEFIDQCFSAVDNKIDCTILCYGYLADQAETQTDWDKARRTVDVNFTSAVSILHLIAERFERIRSGQIAVISSVAGDCGRMSNYTYGASKAGVSAFVQGLRNRLHHANVPVLTVKPGFVDTPMVHGLVDPKSPIVASPQRVAKDIVRAIDKKRNVIYTPWLWWVILTIIKFIPECIFKRLKL